MNPLLQLIEYGQSCWLDNLTRRMIRSGELKRRVDEQGLRGVTSNPAIFNNAISGSNDYDDQIRELVDKGLQIHEIYEQLVVTDIREACDVLRPVYDESDGIDGFISLEVSPYLAHDTEGTRIEGRRLFQTVDRPNLLIKVPGTPAGIPAIEEMLYEGININVTLLFSIQSYEAVAEAYIRALERRLAGGKPVKNTASVASFFLSRLDVLTDQLLGHRIRSGVSAGKEPKPHELLGKFANANAKLAYQSFKQILASDRWKKLEEKGARVQRLLWASTSTKNPLYRDVCYVEPLIGTHTVNTMPDETIEAFADHGIIVKNSVEMDVNESQNVLKNLRKVGLNPDFITQQLLDEGVQKFIDPFDKLMTTIAEKRLHFLGKNHDSQTFALGKSKGAVQSALDSLRSRQFPQRIFEGDPSLWPSEPGDGEKIKNRLGWLNSIGVFRERVAEIKEFASEIKGAGFLHVVLLGMGGSSLCPEVCRETFVSCKGWPQLTVLDNTDPAAVKGIVSQVDLEKTLFVVASKSGTTGETLSFYNYFYELVKNQVKGEPGHHFIAITDPATPLVAEAQKRRFRRCFENQEDIGGRFSALSYFGLVPMCLMGMDIDLFLDRAKQMQYSCGPYVPAAANPAVQLGTILGIQHQLGRDKVTFVISEPIRTFGYWVEQLLAESTGKDGFGIVPIEGEPLGSPSIYSNDRIFVYMHTMDSNKEDIEERLLALEVAGHPVIRIEVRDKMNLGAEFFRWELATATAGSIMGVNPFDEPNVAESKQNTHDLLDEWRQKGQFNEGYPAFEESGISIHCDPTQKWFHKIEGKSVLDFLRSFVGLAKPPDYIALLPYFLRTPERHNFLQSIRLSLRDRLKVATTLGYGPRYLHSTGQLHKGGPNTGVFIILTADCAEDIAIPRQQYGFATLQRAQALGDFHSLKNKKRRVIRIHLSSQIEGGLKLLAERILQPSNNRLLS
ncbi:MAG: transaldolase [Deltaproteobacteria bacterium CG2_30_43_15]|nr:MAG: transaldolase [Deltaproteobacteria bacterium CG2_30_43_15]